jgi:hypothetical protein
MSVGGIFLLLAVILFALWGMGVAVVPRVEAWGLATFALGVLLGGVHFPPWPRP